MVFDNADNLTPEELEEFFPTGLGGNILVTSCNSGLRHLTLHENSLEVKEMQENDAISLLLKAACLGESQEDLQAEASKIVKELWLLIRLVLSLLMGIHILETILKNITAIKGDYYPTQLSKGHQNITELCMGLGNYHVNK